MNGFTPLETAALLAILEESPKRIPDLRAQLDAASVVGREYIGAGFFTAIAVQARSEPVERPRMLGRHVYARVEGLKYGLGFVLFLQHGRLSLLEAYSCRHEDTGCLRLADVQFRIVRSPIAARAYPRPSPSSSQTGPSKAGLAGQSPAT